MSTLAKLVLRRPVLVAVPPLLLALLAAYLVSGLSPLASSGDWTGPTWITPVVFVAAAVSLMLDTLRQLHLLARHTPAQASELAARLRGQRSLTGVLAAALLATLLGAITSLLAPTTTTLLILTAGLIVTSMAALRLPGEAAKALRRRYGHDPDHEAWGHPRR